MKKLSLISLIMAFAVALSACSTTASTKQDNFKGTKIEKESPADIDGIHIRDKQDLYEMYEPTEVVTMYLTVMEGNEGENTNHTWSEINTYSAYDYEDMGVDRYKVEGLLQVGDENGVIKGELGYNQVSPNCTIQIRGQTSSKKAQKNYKISIKENKGMWRGQQTIALNKHMGDGLRFKNKFAYDMIAGIDEMMGLRTTFVHLYVKDTTAGGSGTFRDYGLYTQVEQLNKTALQAHGLDRNGHLYKINEFEFYRYEDIIKLKTDPDYDEAAFEYRIETKGSDDHQKLIDMLEDVIDYSIHIEKVLEEHFDIENLSYWMAFHLLVGNVDTQSRNDYIYSPLHGKKWYFITWDNDGALLREEHRINNRNDYAAWEEGVSNYWGSIFFRRCLKSPTYRKALDAAVEDIYAYMTPERVNAMAKQYSAVAKPYVYRMPDLQYAPLTRAQYNTIVRSLPQQIEENYKLYKESYEKPMPFFIATPEKRGKKLYIQWENSYDFDKEPVTYTCEVARSINFSNPVAKFEDLIIPEIELDMLPKGQYFVRVTSKNKSGKTQYAFDYYVTDIGKNYGVRCFYIDGSGKIVEDVNVES